MTFKNEVIKHLFEHRHMNILFHFSQIFSYNNITHCTLKGPLISLLNIIWFVCQKTNSKINCEEKKVWSARKVKEVRSVFKSIPLT